MKKGVGHGNLLAAVEIGMVCLTLYSYGVFIVDGGGKKKLEEQGLLIP